MEDPFVVMLKTLLLAVVVSFILGILILLLCGY